MRVNLHELTHGFFRALPFARLNPWYPEIASLGVIGDRHTAAVITASGDVVWYSPGRFDAPSLLGGLLDPMLAGSWRIVLSGASPGGRSYQGEAAILETRLRHHGGTLAITDWMNLSRDDVPFGTLCRRFSPAPADFRLVLSPRPFYGRRLPILRRATPGRVVIEERFQVHGSHPLAIQGASVEMVVPKGEPSWAVLTDSSITTIRINSVRLDQWLASTRRGWSELADSSADEGPWSGQVRASLRALRLLVYEPTGAVSASVTTCLPEIVGGRRNYDYRYTWLRDSGLIVRALLRFQPDGELPNAHVDFVAGLCGSGYHDLIDPISAVGGERVPRERRVRLAGYRGSRPTRYGNKAAKQLQLGSLANFLLGVKELYALRRPRAHWDLVAAVADFLAQNWRRPDSGIWEQQRPQHYTSSRVFAVCALEGIAPFATDPAQAERWRRAAEEIRADVDRSCRTPRGAFSAKRGVDAVDISAALFSVWGYCSPDDPAMRATVCELESRYSPRPGLFRRHLESRRAERREGAFLAGTFWMAHHWVTMGDLDRARGLIDAGLKYANDLGLFPEEIDPMTGAMLGNFPLGLVHASFLAAVADFKAASGP